MSTALAMLAAVLLDAWLGEPRRGHPLVWFGRLATWVERRLHADRRSAGVLAWGVAVLPIVAAIALMSWLAPGWLGWSLAVIVLFGAALLTAPWQTLTVLCVGYVVAIPFSMRSYARVRRLRATPPRAAPPADPF